MKKTLCTLFVTLMFLVLSGCSDLFRPPEQEQTPGTGRVLISIDGAAAPSARTFRPPALSGATYALTFSAAEKEDVILYISETTTDTELESGDWTLVVNAYLSVEDIGDPGKVVSTGTAPVSVTPSGTTPVSVFLAPVQTGTGTGTLSFTITLPSATPASASLTIEKISGEAASPTVNDLLAANTGSVSLPPGTYRLTVKLSDGAGKYARWVGIAQVCQNLETTANCVLEDSAFTDSFFTNVAALSSWLSAADENTVSDPYPIYLAIEDFTSLAGTGGGLTGILDALHGRYVSLDLSESAAGAIPSVAGTYAAHIDADKILSIALPSGLETIGDYGLAGLSEVTSLTIPATVTDIGGAAFSGSGIAQFTVDGSSNFTTDGSMLLGGTTLLAYPAASGKITIPGNIAIGPGAFAGSALTSLKVTGAVTSIGAGAFKDCLSLATVNLPSSITNIGDEAFAGCSALKRFNIPVDNPPALGSNAFAEHDESLKIAVPYGKGSSYTGASNWVDYTDFIIAPEYSTFDDLADMTEYIAQAAGGSSTEAPVKVGLSVDVATLNGGNLDVLRKLFDALPADKYVYVDLSESYGNFGDGAATSYSGRANADRLVGITLPQTITRIARSMFYGCSSLKELIVPSGVTELYSGSTFDNCGQLEKIDLSATTISTISGASVNDLLAGCVSLKTLLLPDSLKELCRIVSPVLESLHIGPNLATIRTDSSGYGSIRSRIVTLTVDPANPTFALSADGKVLYNKTTGAVVYLASGNCAIPATVTTIPAAALRGIDNVTGLSIPATVSNIAVNAYSGRNIEFTVDSANTVYKAGNGILYTVSGRLVYAKNPDEAYSLNLPEGITEIPASYFNARDQMTSITLPDGLTTIGNMAFQGCTGLTTSLMLPTTVTSIGTDVFSGTQLSITSTGDTYKSAESGNILYAVSGGVLIYAKDAAVITIPGAVTNIPANFFENRTTLAQISLATGVISIGNNAFRNCASLVTVTLPSSLTTIGNYAFQNCDALATVTLPSSLTTIGNYAFEDCDALKTVDLSSTQITTTGTYTFQNCDALATVKLPSTLKTIGSSAFRYCTSLTWVKWPASETGATIGSNAFRDCTSLNYVELPDNLSLTERSIGSNAFASCSIKVFIVRSTTVPMWASNVTSAHLLLSDASSFIYVPDTSEAAYEAAQGWSVFADSIKPLSALSPSDGPDNWS